MAEGPVTGVALRPLDLLSQFRQIFAILSLFVCVGTTVPLLVARKTDRKSKTQVRSFGFAPLGLLFLLGCFVAFALLVLE